MSAVNFKEKTVPQLHEYIKSKGISAAGYKKNDLVKIAEFVSTLNCPNDPNFAGDNIEKVIEERHKQVGCDLNPFKLTGYSSDLSNIPNFTLYDIFNYLLLHRADYDKKKLKAFKSAEDYRLYYDGHVENLEYVSKGSISVFRTKVKPTQRDKTFASKTYYDSWFIICNATGEVLAAYCECPGGADGACRHIAASLYELESYEQKSVTDGPCLWKKRPRAHDQPVQISKLKIHKAKYSDRNAPMDLTQDAVFDPRHENDRAPISEDGKIDFAKKLYEINPKACALEFLPLPEIQAAKGYQNESIDHLNIITKAKLFLEDHSLSNGENIHDLSVKVLTNLKYTVDEISYIEEMTFGQSDNQNWYEMRKGLLTASKFERICVTKHGEDDLLAETMGYVQKPSNKFTQMCCDWGLKMEPKVRKLYQISECKKHKKFKISEHGLKISEDHPFIGCSIDGLVSCSCHPDKLIEIKCPFSLRDKHPKEAAQIKGCELEDGKWQMKADGPYYHQIQGQLGIYGLMQCDLIIYTKKGHVVIPVLYDEKFFLRVLSKLKEYYVSNVLPEIITSEVKNEMTKIVSK